MLFDQVPGPATTRPYYRKHAILIRWQRVYSLRILIITIWDSETG
jgi:hypothetical protein